MCDPVYFYYRRLAHHPSPSLCIRIQLLQCTVLFLKEVLTGLDKIDHRSLGVFGEFASASHWHGLTKPLEAPLQSSSLSEVLRGSGLQAIHLVHKIITKLRACQYHVYTGVSRRFERTRE